MATSKLTKSRPWYSPGVLADFANNGFLSVARGTGAVVRGIQSGSSKGVAVIVKPIVKPLQKKLDVPAIRPPAKPLAVAKTPAMAAPKPASASFSAADIQPEVASQAGRPEPAPAPSVRSDDRAPVASPSDLGDPVSAEISTEAEFAPTTKSEVAVEPESAPARKAPEAPAPAVVARKPVGEGQETGGVTGFFRSLLKSEPKPEAVVSRDRPGQTAATRPAASPLAARPALPKQFIDVEAVVANHPFANRADMLSALVSVNEFIHGSSRESSDAQKQILLIGGALAEPVFLAALQGKSAKLAELAFDGLARLKSEHLVPSTKEMLSSPDRDLRLAALRAAHWLDDEDARPLFAIAANDPAPEVRRRLVCYLSWRAAPWAMFELRRLCNDDNLVVKWAAIGVLTRVQPEVALELMGRSPPSGDDAGYRHRIQAALAKKKAGGDKARSSAERATAHSPEGQSQP
jgi:HEAT repeats